MSCEKKIFKHIYYSIYVYKIYIYILCETEIILHIYTSCIYNMQCIYINNNKKKVEKS